MLREKTFPCDEYQELVELILFFFLVDILKEFSIFSMPLLIIMQDGCQKPFIQKIFLLSRTFKFNDKEAKKIERMSKYAEFFYEKYFLKVAITTATPTNDLYFFYLIRMFKSIDHEDVEETITSIEQYFGYLGGVVVFFLFDNSVYYAEKTMMGQKLINIYHNIYHNLKYSLLTKQSLQILIGATKKNLFYL